MYNGGKIMAGLLIFLVLITYPVWYNIANGKATYRPDPVVQTANEPGRDQCMLPEGEMKTKHMELLNTWRNEVVRENKVDYVASNGHHYEMSLTRTCTDCHSNTTEFCDRCHNYMGVEPYCWDCHIEPRSPMVPVPGGEGGEQ